MQTKLQTWTGILINVITVNVYNDKDVKQNKALAHLPFLTKQNITP
jgi:hypothetical protein